MGERVFNFLSHLRRINSNLHLPLCLIHGVGHDAAKAYKSECFGQFAFEALGEVETIGPEPNCTEIIGLDNTEGLGESLTVVLSLGILALILCLACARSWIAAGGSK